MEPNYAICIEVFPERCTSRPQLQIIVHSHAREISVIRDSNENSIKVQIDPFTPGIRNEEGTSYLLKTEQEDMKKTNFHVD